VFQEHRQHGRNGTPMDSLDSLRLCWGIGFVVFVAIVCGTTFFFRRLWAKPTRARGAAVRLSLLLFAVVAQLFVLEFLLSYALVQSDGYGETLAARLWFRRHWQPINSYGYRDYEVKHFAGRSAILVVGDSFVAGHGIKRVEDRFPNILAGLLGTNWEYAVIAGNGWDTRQELRGLQKYPIRPDIVVLSYYINDIEGAAERRGSVLPRLVSPPAPTIRWAVNRSFLANWVYWRGYRRTLGDDYWNYLRNAYHDAGIWSDHTAELKALVQYARSGGAAVVAVIWPSLIKLSQSLELTTKIDEFLRGNGATVVNPASRFQGRRQGELTVNALDAHPNPQIHREVAALIYQEMVARGLVR
jgi:hypothetical protein